MSVRLLSMKDVTDRVPFTRVHVYRLMKGVSFRAASRSASAACAGESPTSTLGSPRKPRGHRSLGATMTDREFSREPLEGRSPVQTSAVDRVNGIEHAPKQPSEGGACIKGDTDQAVKFTQMYRVDSPIVLTSIHPETGAVWSDTFRPEQDEMRLRAWIDERQGQQNIYFHVNPTTGPLSGRVNAKKEHIRGMIALHVDLDPRPGGDLSRCAQAGQRMRA